MNALDPAVTRRLAERLRQHEAELSSKLRDASRAGAEAEDPSQQVQDFKDVAALEATTAVDDVAVDHATRELGQVQAALQRLRDGTYGLCRECGETIAESRLGAMPWAALCTACQTADEQAARRH